MFEKFARSWQMTKQSWAVLRQEKQLMIFPLISTILTLLVSASFLAPPIIYLAVTKPEWLEDKNMPMEWRIASGVIMFLLYFVTYSIIAFCNAALIGSALNSFDGKDASAKAGMRIAMSRLPQILGWSLINATVGVAIQMLRERAGWIADKVLGLLGIAWTIATFFVVPVLVVEGVGPIKATKRSFEIMRKAWGETLVTQGGVGLFFGLLTLLVVLVPVVLGIVWSIAIQSVWPIAVIGPIALIVAVMLALVSSTLKMILVAASYRYVSTGETPYTFERDSLQGMFAPKKK